MRTHLLHLFTVCATILGSGAAMSATAKAEASDIDLVKAANQAYYAALSARDLSAMERVWARTPEAANVAPPVKPVAHTGWDAIEKNYQAYWATLDSLTVSMADPRVVIRGSVAWIYGIEQATRKAKNGQVSGGPNFGTSIFIKDDKRWLMVFHQTSLIPNRK